MALHDRNKPVGNPPECPNGSDGPPCSDGMIEFVCGLVGRMMEAARKHGKIELGIMEGEGDINSKAFGGITYVFAMARYIQALEDELKKGPILGVEDLSSLEKRSIHTVTADKIIFEGGTALVRNGLNWEWTINKD